MSNVASINDVMTLVYIVSESTESLDKNAPMCGKTRPLRYVGAKNVFTVLLALYDTKL